MIELIKQCLQSPAGSFGFVFSLLILAFYLVHWITKKVTTINNSHSGLSKAIEKIELNIDNIKSDLSYVKGSINILNAHIPNPTIQSKSPISLTELGERLAKEMDLQDIIIRNWDKIYDYLDKNLISKNAYDIQQFCIDTASISLDKFFIDSDIDNIKNFAFKNGNPLMYYGSMIGVMIRDAYFKQKGIDVSDVDKCEKETKVTIV